MTVDIAMAALVNDGKLLLGHRHPERRWYPDCWDLIGGHVEEGESPDTAVRRECREEIAVDIEDPRRVPCDFELPGIRPYAFIVTRWSGQPTNTAPEEHDQLGWFDVDELAGLRLAHPLYVGWLPKLLADADRHRDRLVRPASPNPSDLPSSVQPI